MFQRKYILKNKIIKNISKNIVISFQSKIDIILGGNNAFSWDTYIYKIFYL